MFYGLIIYLYFYDNKQHSIPHIHVEYQRDEALFSIIDSSLIKGDLPVKKIRLVQAWIDIHQEELMANWALAIKGEQVFKIEPLR